MARLLILAGFCLFYSFAAAAPADGNGNKVVSELNDLDVPINCDGIEGPEIWADVTGFIQFRQFNENGNRNVELTVYHIDIVYKNAMGDAYTDSWLWRDRGPDRLYFVTNDNGDPELHVAITGRAGVNIIGHYVLNLVTGEVVLNAGQHPFGGDVFEENSDTCACDLLTG
jgi:hypothetical protein